MKAPIRARVPPMIQAPSAMAGVGTSRATTAGFLNMPAPIMPPMTMRVASKGPSLWAKPFSAGAGWEGSVLMPESSARRRSFKCHSSATHSLIGFLFDHPQIGRNKPVKAFYTFDQETAHVGLGEQVSAHATDSTT